MYKLILKCLIIKKPIIVQNMFIFNNTNIDVDLRSFSDPNIINIGADETIFSDIIFKDEF